MKELNCLIIADDLTGACDTAVQFARGGAGVSVMLAMDSAPATASVIAISTDSRNLPEAEAAALVARLAEYGTARILYKKIDSVLRGNPGAEIAAALEAFACDAVVATPAFPAMGRRVEASNCAEVARCLRSEAHVPPGGVAGALAAGARVVSCDADCERDLEAIVAAGMASGKRILWAGSGGLAAALAGAGPGRPAARGSVHADAVFVIGSDHPVTLEQVERLREARPGTIVLPIGPVPDAAALVLSGGDTACAICREAGVRRIDLIGEILPGIPWGVLRRGRFDGIPVATKSGGFGQPDALIRIAEFFQ